MEARPPCQVNAPQTAPILRRPLLPRPPAAETRERIARERETPSATTTLERPRLTAPYILSRDDPEATRDDPPSDPPPGARPAESGTRPQRSATDDTPNASGIGPQGSGTPSASPSPSVLTSAAKTPVRVPRPWEKTFLASLMARGVPAEAARAAGVARETAYQHAQRHPDFAQAWREAQAIAYDRMEDELYRRGVEGWDEPVFFAGEQVGARRQYDGTLLLAGLKAKRPEYRDRVDLTHAAPDGGPVRTASEVTVQLQPYEGAIAMMVGGIVAREVLQRPALPAPAASADPSGKAAPGGGSALSLP